MITTLTLTAALLLTGAQVDTGTKEVTFRGMTLQIPSSWKLKKSDGGDAIHVLTGGCPARAMECRGFWLLGPRGIKYASEGGPYELEEPYHPSTGVTECTLDKHYWSEPQPQKPSVSGVRPMGAGHKATYRQWQIDCHTPKGKPTKVGYPQKIWHLPKSKILVVDEFSTPGLDRIFKNAVWK
ncbi:hypothetical protein ACIBG8_50105 [Nonomuraea sp. NPDC050556]|uniref:hypothetical protein n=1 Tax=Nonomuraea sp. NPDC050556 TaxID=3364369 RepID=UPI00379A67DE